MLFAPYTYLHSGKWVHPKTGKNPIPTMNIGMRYIRPNQSGPTIRKTENLIAVCYEGSGEIVFPEESKSFTIVSHDVGYREGWKIFPGYSAQINRESICVNDGSIGRLNLKNIVN